jgi:hypothetical protein
VRKLVFRTVAWTFCLSILLVCLTAILVFAVAMILSCVRTWAIIPLRDWADDFDYYSDNYDRLMLLD